LKALFVTHYPFFGGPQNHIMRLRSPLAVRGWEVLALLPDEEGNAAERMRSFGVPVFTLPLHRLGRSIGGNLRMLAMLPAEVAAIRRLLRKEQVDVVVVLGVTNPHAAIAAKLEHVPVVWELHDTFPPWFVRALFMLPVLGLADVVLACGDVVARAHPGAHSFGPRLIKGIYTLDSRTFKPDPEARKRARELLGFPQDALVVGTVANFSPQKGLDYFVETSRLIEQRLPDACFALLGAPMQTQPELANQIRKLVASTQAARHGRFVLRDPGTDVPFYLQAFDLFLLTSVARSEGLPATILEAMATALPVVATEVGSVAEVVEDGVTGRVVPPQDAAAMAMAGIALLEDPNLRAWMGAEARYRAETLYDIGIFAGTMQSAFEAALSSPRPSRKGRGRRLTGVLPDKEIHPARGQGKREVLTPALSRREREKDE
jgi:glycosyltransferase involved in cell wall biosynthesis